MTIIYVVKRKKKLFYWWPGNSNSAAAAAAVYLKFQKRKKTFYTHLMKLHNFYYAFFSKKCAHKNANNRFEFCRIYFIRVFSKAQRKKNTYLFR